MHNTCNQSYPTDEGSSEDLVVIGKDLNIRILLANIFVQKNRIINYTNNIIILSTPHSSHKHKQHP